MYEFVISERLPVAGQEAGNSPVVKEVARCSGDAAEVAMFLRAIADRLAPFRPHSGPVFRSQRPGTVDLRPDLKQQT